MRTDWWSRFFSGPWLDVQRRAREDRTAAEADFLASSLELPRGSKVLDVPCGNGRLALALAERGHDLTGVDITNVLLEEAREKATAAGLEVEWVNSDMRHLSWTDAFDGAFCFWGSFGYFDDTGNEDFLRAVHRALKPTARFVLEVPNVAETILPRMQETWDWDRVGDISVREKRSYNYVDSRLETVWTFLRDGEEERKESSVRVYTYRELCNLFALVGFQMCHAYSSVDREPYELGRRAYFVVEEELRVSD